MQNNDVYKTILNLSEGIFKDKGSKFIARAYPVTTEEEIKEILSGLKKEFYDARHHCFAYRLGPKGEKFRANDDGEPSSSAGKPILGQLLSKELTNLVVFVIRYFGGTKLGVPGLINAYKSATIDAIENNTVIEKTINEVYSIEYDYLVMNDVMKIIKDEEPEIQKQEFELICKMHLSIRQEKAARLSERLEKVESLILKHLGTF